MRTPDLAPFSFLLALFAGTSALPAGAGGMYVESCNLGCSSGAGGTQVTAQTIEVHQDFELSVTFSLAVDPASIQASSFRIVNTADGTTPSGAFVLDPLDARTVVFRPSVTFDLGGNPIYALDPNSAYMIFVPGTAQGDAGPFVRSAGGLDNTSRFQHTILTSLGLIGPIRESCGTSPNSAGPGAELALVGSTSLAGGAITGTIVGAPAGVSGVFFAGVEPRRLPFGEGVRCTGGGLRRLAPVVTDGAGSASRSLDLGALGAGPGDRRIFQFWYRDTAVGGGPTSNLSGALEVRLFP